MIAASEIKLSCVIDQADAEAAINTLCQTFEIDHSSATPNPPQADLTALRGVALDQNQAHVAILNVPDRVGMAAKIFSVLAASKISVDMIVQSERTRQINGQQTRDLVFTIDQDQSSLAVTTINALKPELMAETEIMVETDVAKVSIVGSGMIGQPGIAARLFSALAQENINILMITTSEIKISCMIPQAQAIQAVKVIHKAFELDL
jgi:aspartate kinase